MKDIPHLPALVHAEKTHFRMPSRPHWIEPTVEYLRQKAVLCGACQETRSGKLLLALHEALANAIIHGNLELSSELKEKGDNSFAEALAQRAAEPRLARRVVDIVVDYDGQCCRWFVTDQGRGFDIGRVLERVESDDPEVLLASGRGILIMRSFLDEVRYEEGGRRLVLTMYRASGEEKREHPRVDVQEPVRVAPIRADGSVDWEAAYRAVAHNFSETGMGLLQEQLAATDRILIAVQVGGEPVYIPAEVRHCRQLGSDFVELGCRFQPRAHPAAPKHSSAEPLTLVQQTIGELMESRKGLPAGVHERRAHPRMVYNDRVQVFRPGSREPVSGYCRDLSKGGLAFVTTTPLAPDEVLVVLPKEKDQAIRIRAQIIRCNRITEGFFDVGARFLAMEPASP